LKTGAKKFYKKEGVDLGVDIPVVTEKEVDIFAEDDGKDWFEEEW